MSCCKQIDQDFAQKTHLNKFIALFSCFPQTILSSYGLEVVELIDIQFDYTDDGLSNSSETIVCFY